MKIEGLVGNGERCLDRALILNGDEAMRQMLERTLQEGHWKVTLRTLEDRADPAEDPWLLIILCVIAAGANPADAINKLRSTMIEKQARIVVVSRFPTSEELMACLQSGASDYLAWPILPAEIEAIAGRIRKVAAYEAMNNHSDLCVSPAIAENDRRVLIGTSPAMLEVSKQVIRVAATPGMRVFITGETGTGKEVAAWQIHRQSGCRGPFRAINCAATVETLLESDLFGHERGAFTGALAMKKGLWEEAAEGTLFLDEITESSLAVQAKLLRALQEGVIRRVGANHEIKVTARIIAASNRDVEQAILEGRFREDLYYRLGQIIHLPPLRERREDIPPLVEHFCRAVAAAKMLTPEAIEALTEYDWPGNIRQLEGVVHQLLLYSDRFVFREDVARVIPIGHSGDEAAQKVLQSFWQAAPAGRRGPWPTLGELRHWYVHQVFKILGKESAVARVLGIDARTVCSILQRGTDEQFTERRNEIR